MFGYLKDVNYITMGIVIFWISERSILHISAWLRLNFLNLTRIIDKLPLWKRLQHCSLGRGLRAAGLLMTFWNEALRAEWLGKNVCSSGRNGPARPTAAGRCDRPVAPPAGPILSRPFQVVCRSCLGKSAKDTVTLKPLIKLWFTMAEGY